MVVIITKKPSFRRPCILHQDWSSKPTSAAPPPPPPPILLPSTTSSNFGRRSRSQPQHQHELQQQQQQRRPEAVRNETNSTENSNVTADRKQFEMNGQNRAENTFISTMDNDDEEEFEAICCDMSERELFQTVRFRKQN